MIAGKNEHNEKKKTGKIVTVEVEELSIDILEDHSLTCNQRKQQDLTE